MEFPAARYVCPSLLRSCTDNPAQQSSSIFSRLNSDLSSYESAQQTIAVSLANALNSVLAGVTDDIGIAEPTSWYLTDRASALNSIITGTPTWLAPLPSDVQSYIKSVATAEASIINRDINAGTRVDAVLKAGIAAVVGVGVGVVIML